MPRWLYCNWKHAIGRLKTKQKIKIRTALPLQRTGTERNTKHRVWVYTFQSIFVCQHSHIREANALIFSQLGILHLSRPMHSHLVTDITMG